MLKEHGAFSVCPISSKPGIFHVAIHESASLKVTDLNPFSCAESTTVDVCICGRLAA